MSELSLQQLQAGELSAKYREAHNLDPIIRLQISAELTEFPSEIFELADSLEVLDLSNNELTDLPDDLERLVNLRILFLSNNNFQKIPKVVASCPKLEMISFKSNDLVEVGEDVLPLDTRWLILTDNRIEALPNSFGQLHRLQKLALAGNRLTELPESMASCQNLELARLSANNLVSMPDWLFQLPKLTWLAFSGNAFNRCSATSTHSMIDVPLIDIELEHLIGEGASGYIHRASWNNQPQSLVGSDNQIAVKIFKGDVTSDGYPEDELDCCLMAGEHDSLIKVIAKLDKNDSDKTSGLVMELIPSNFYNLGLPPSLETCTRDTFKKGDQFSAQAILKVCYQLALGLSHIHSNCISHGDIYAHNTMINSDFDVLFGDFGAATNLTTLPTLLQESMERIEVRALGCLMDDLLKLRGSENRPTTSLEQGIRTLAANCMQADISMRPRFSELEIMLARLTELEAEGAVTLS